MKKLISCALAGTLLLFCQDLQFPKIYGTLENQNYALASWYAALANDATASPAVYMFGDSITAGTGASPTTNGFAYLLNSRTTQMFPQGTASPSFTFMPTTTQSCQPSLSNCSWTIAGTLTSLANWGVQSGVIGAPKVGGAGQTATLATTAPFAFTSMDIIYLTNTDTAAGFTVNIDGGGATTYGNVTSGSLTWARQNIAGLSNAGHSAVITFPASGNAYIWGVYLHPTTTGVVEWDNFGLSGTSATGWCVNPSAVQNSGWMTVAPSAPSLIIEALGTNDYNGTLATWAANIDTCVAYWHTTFPAASILMVDMQNQAAATGGDGVSPRELYYAATRQTAAKYGAAYINVGDAWGAWANANSLGLQASGGNAALHPSNIGHWDIASQILRLLFRENLPQNTGAVGAPVYSNFNPIHLGCSGKAPTLTLGAAAASTASINGTLGPGPGGTICDSAGHLNIVNSGSVGTASSELFRVTFGTPFVNVPVCTLTPTSSQSASLSGNAAVYWNKQNSTSSYASFSVGSTAVGTVNAAFAWTCWGR